MTRIQVGNGAPRSRLAVPFLTCMWGDIPAIGWRIPPRPKAVPFFCREDPSGRITVSFPNNPLFVSKVKTIKGFRWPTAEKQRQKDMLIKGLKRWSFGIVGILILFVVSPGLADKWSQRYIESLPDSAFAAIEITKDGEKVRHLPHHNHVGEIDIYHLKSALGRIHQVKWMDPGNFPKARDHLEQHYRVYKQERAKARGLGGPININKASIDELMQLPHIGQKLAIALVEYRKTHQGFETISDLMHVPGIGEKKFKDIEDLVIVE